MKHVKNTVSGKDNKFFIELYPDCSTYNYEELIKSISDSTVRFAYILHDKDVTEDGEIKKPHTHLFCHTENQQSIKSFCEKFGIAPCYVAFAISERACIRYLLHLDNPEKFQYNLDEIVCNYDLKKFFVDKDIDSMNCIGEIFSAINNYGFKRFTDLLQWGLSTGKPEIVKVISNRSYMWKQVLSENA